ncbi:hypothetical protein B5E58_12125 [Tyzzerella sp. An114]|uniref:hypothetical protein n=1 Tax=Tyzzerella sp. An114 TaxID=1965545 RepID=UPI000B454B2E|nr:hypothetical protein [Tyzzerella sp. An114]OUQ55534.1 hypothetical protein B5E58_12125 [Tyzzerella sp. An114]
MKIAIIGSRSLSINNLEEYIPKDASEIVSGGAIGIDNSAKNYALSNNIKFTEFLPKYNKYGKSAPLKRNIEIIQYSDYIIAFWDGKSKGTKFVIDNCKKLNIPIEIYKINI